MSPPVSGSGRGCSGGKTTSIPVRKLLQERGGSIETTPQFLRPIVGISQALTQMDDICDVQVLFGAP
jgi:hypothetical protein